MNTVRINGQDYTSSLSDAEIAFMGNFSLPTTAQTLSGAIAEHENDISELNSNLFNNTIHSLTPSDSTKVSITDGGYWQIGKLVIINVRFDVSSTINAGSNVLSSVPNPKSANGSNLVPVTVFGLSSYYNVYVITGTTSTTTIRTNVSIGAGSYFFSACYVAA